MSVTKVLQHKVAKSFFNITFLGSPNALVGLTGVDRAAYFLFNESRLTRDSMFQRMDSYDQGCIRNGGENNKGVFLV